MKNGAGAAVAGVVAVIMVPLLVVIMVLGSGGKEAALAACAPSGNVTVSVPGGNVAGYSGEQLANAATVVKAGQDLKIPAEGLLIGVMTAMGESSLKNINYGDDIHGVTNPDGSLTCSLGLYQQQWCLPGNPWGTKADVMDPAKAAATFYKALLRLSGWQSMAPDVAAHRVQGNYSPAGYTKFIPAAREVLEAVTAGKIKVGATGCTAGGFAAGSSGSGDDYPWKGAEHNANNPITRLAYRNCTDFAWWRLTQQLGLEPVSSSKLGPGNANTWGNAWSRAGWTISKTPKVGAIVWYNTGQYGHVAVVKEIKSDGTVIEEGYNFGIPPNGAYYTMTINPNTPAGYLYLPTREQFETAAM
ncbi:MULTISPECIES: CHAP domain-containing protein [Paenarthrobacter]|uniref:CHAP domain-containing protein n=1 Tax=Paenarthrobacter ureafaciens TaxID=37931 RepID=A0AAX3EQH5_PAEUR|nr:MULTISPECIES: CHAP domain-containing protein [Paenarthrobacter]MDO5867133.1 CHAP domain-containing protein [Paenarthrobacter sp. SD-2]MDO5878345.1 CHAP domain-containing protein [Paenarthrobacter sp. SD-1]UYV95573.1 CHAP domain-containing protein [Paenarthrobacter ureafaciens]UYW00257.1 CHAP domain-containing protein [Paenarthrobacter ureafaciens]